MLPQSLVRFCHLLAGTTQLWISWILLKHCWVSSRSDLCYTSFAQNSHTSCPEMTSAAFFFFGDLLFLFRRLCLFSFPAGFSHWLSAARGNKSCPWFEVSQKRAGLLFPVFVRSSLPVCMPHMQTIGVACAGPLLWTFDLARNVFDTKVRNERVWTHCTQHV